METELLHEIVEAAQPPSEKPPAPLRVARSPHPLDNFSFDQLCPAEDDESTQENVQEEATAQDEPSAQQDAPAQKDLPKGPFKGPINKVAAPPGVRKSERYVPKTMLDHNLILQNLAVSVAKSQEKWLRRWLKKSRAIQAVHSD